jgi:serine/threonine protein kinase
MVERFRRTRLLGKGGFGKVYEAIDMHSGETVALKELFGNFTTFSECRNMPEVKAL